MKRRNPFSAERSRHAALALLLCACAGTHQPEPVATDPDIDSGTSATADAGGSALPPDASSAADAAPTEIRNPDTGAIDVFDDGSLTKLAPAVQDAFKALEEPDFTAPPLEVASETCGFVFHIAEHSKVQLFMSGTIDTEVTRVFDADGRLLVAHEDITGAATLIPPTGVGGSRMQFDYDEAGRVRRLRETTFADQLYNRWSSVVDLTYAQDGSYVAELFTTRVPDDFFQAWGLCSRMEFDAGDRLVRESWGCDQAQEARVYRYDARGRPLEVKGTAPTGVSEIPPEAQRFDESPQWTIRWDYADDDSSATVTWNELDRRKEQPVDVEQRLVRRFDAQQRLTSVEFDYANDGTFDERVDYRYANDQSTQWDREAYDFGIDGLVDLVEEHSTEGASLIIERRHMTQAEDEQRSNYAIGFPADPQTSRDPMTPESVLRWTLSIDAVGRPIVAELRRRSVVPPEGEVSSAVSSQRLRYSPEGYVEHVEVEEVRNENPATGSRRETTCSLEPACDNGGQPTPPQDAALLACQTSQATASDYTFLPQAEPPYLPPPFHRIEGLRTRNRYAARFDPRPPTVREIVGY